MLILFNFEFKFLFVNKNGNTFFAMLMQTFRFVLMDFTFFYDHMAKMTTVF